MAEFKPEQHFPTDVVNALPKRPVFDNEGTTFNVQNPSVFALIRLIVFRPIM